MHWLAVIPVIPYFFLLLKIYRNLIKITTFKVSDLPSTFVSVVIACRNEQENISVLLSSIANQDYPQELYEVIVVNDNSTDKTFEIASGFTGIDNLITINSNGKGKKQAIRTGINVSSGWLIITTDADCRMGNRWLTTIAGFFEKYKPSMIICPVKLNSGKGLFGKFQELEFLSLQGITAGTASSEEAIMCNGANLAFKREAYLINSGNLNDEIASGDDIFLLHSLKKQIQSKIYWLESTDSIVTAALSPTLRSFLNQRCRWISKWEAYNDRNTILLGIVTFVTIILQIIILIAGFINPTYLWVFLVLIILKSIPDYLILLNSSGRYEERELMKWFLPAQIIYPFYVICVVFYSLISAENRDINSPFPKET
jgi:poly-beta-1,6-N-acetyl-D-glucosamine synthase